MFNFISWLKGEKRGLIRLVRDIRDLRFKDLNLGNFTPKHRRIELAPIFPENQHSLNVCDFEATANALAIYFGEAVSVRWLTAKSYQMRKCAYGGAAQVQIGAYVARKWGVVFEKDLPSDERMSFDEFVNIDFSKFDQIAEKNKIGSYHFIETVDELLQAIDQGYAIVIGRNFPANLTSPWILPFARLKNNGHATCVIGYDLDKVVNDSSKGTNIEINSWGTFWGDNGKFYCPLDALQQDLDYYGAVAITPIPYTPKDLKIKEIETQITSLKDKIKTMNEISEKLYTTAKGQLGRNLAPGNEMLGCVLSFCAVYNMAFPNEEPLRMVGTGQLADFLENSPKFEKVDSLEKADILIYRTDRIPPECPFKGRDRHGHVFIPGRLYSKEDGSRYLMSNNSWEGMWDTQWTEQSADEHYHIIGKMEPEYFKKVA